LLLARQISDYNVCTRVHIMCLTLIRYSEYVNTSCVSISAVDCNHKARRHLFSVIRSIERAAWLQNIGRACGFSKGTKKGEKKREKNRKAGQWLIWEHFQSSSSTAEMTEDVAACALCKAAAMVTNSELGSEGVSCCFWWAPSSEKRWSTLTPPQPHRTTLWAGNWHFEVAWGGQEETHICHWSVSFKPLDGCWRRRKKVSVFWS